MTDERRALLEEAERLKKQRSETEAEAARARASIERRKRAELTESRPSKLRASVSPYAVWVALGLGATALMFFGFSRDDEVSDDGRAQAARVSIGLVGATLLAVGWRLSAPSRFRRWAGQLPFPLIELETLLASGGAVSRVEVELAFRDAAPDVDVVKELVFAKVPRSDPEQVPEVSWTRGNLRIHQRFDLATTNHPLYRWARHLVERVLAEVHRGYPLAGVTFVAVEREEFHNPNFGE